MFTTKDIKPLLRITMANDHWPLANGQWPVVAIACSTCLYAGKSIANRTLVVIDTTMISRIYNRKHMKLNFLLILEVMELL